MEEKIFTYEGETLTVTYDLKRCIHAARCVHGLPDVFDPNRKPWVEVNNATPDALKSVIEECPTGALKYQEHGTDTETKTTPCSISVSPDGPIYMKGTIVINTDSGEPIREEARAAFCRCGASKNKPFCDGAHSKAGFQDAGSLGSHKLQPSEDQQAPLNVKLINNGPLLLDGPFVLHAAGDEEPVEGAKGALCRCGASNNKPFCDGTHRSIEFDTGGF